MQVSIFCVIACCSLGNSFDLIIIVMIIVLTKFNHCKLVNIKIA